MASRAPTRNSGPLRVHPHNPRCFADRDGPPTHPTGWHTWPRLQHLGGTSGTLAVEWLDPAAGRAQDGKAVSGGGKRRLAAPFAGDAVLYIHRQRT